MKYHWDHYHQMLWLHQQGKDPGLPNWSPTWRIADFDRGHLRCAMDLSTQLRQAQELLDSMIDLCAKAGIEALEWQDQDFPVNQAYNYTESQEQKLIDQAPRSSIERWRHETADHESLLQGQRSVIESHHNPRMYPGEHVIEWPSDVDLEIGRDVQAFDSASCVADENFVFDYRSRRIKQTQPIAPPSWTWRGTEQRLETDNSKVLHSHYL